MWPWTQTPHFCEVVFFAALIFVYFSGKNFKSYGFSNAGHVGLYKTRNSRIKFFRFLFRVRIWPYVTGFFWKLWFRGGKRCGRDFRMRVRVRFSVHRRIPRFRSVAHLICIFVIVRVPKRRFYFFFNSSYHTLFFSTILFFRFFMFAHLRVLAYFNVPCSILCTLLYTVF